MERPRLQGITGWRVAVVCLALGFAFTGPLLVYRFLDATQTTVGAQQKVRVGWMPDPGRCAVCSSSR